MHAPCRDRAVWGPLLALGLGCGGPPVADPAAATAAYAAALAAVAADPAQSAVHCGAVAEGPLRTDCLLAGAEALAAQDPPAAAALCGGLAAGLAQDECHFQVAERSGEPARCSAAGRFAEDCRMHGWTRTVMAAVAAGAEPVPAVARLAPLAAAAGFAPDDPRPWIAAFRHLHGGPAPLDLSRCGGLAPVPGAACGEAARMLLHDRISHARDRRSVDCAGPLPAALAVAEGAENDPLRAILDERREELCR